MKRIEGNTRWVLVFKYIIVKVAKIDYKRAIMLSKSLYKEGLLYEFLTYEIDMYSTPQFFLMKGIVANWREFIRFWRLRSRFLQPTYFSFFGLINIQKKGVVLQMSDEKCFAQLERIIGDDIWISPHTFGSSQNFCVTGSGKLRVLDYGASLSFDLFLRKWGDSIYDEFNINF